MDKMGGCELFVNLAVELKSHGWKWCWVTELVRECDTEFYRTSEEERRGETGLGWYDWAGNNICLPEAAFPSAGEIPPLCELRPEVAATVIEEAFHAWYDQVGEEEHGLSWNAELEESISNYLSFLLERWFTHKGKSTKEDIAIEWPEVLKSARMNLNPVPTLADFETAKKHGFDFEAPPPPK